MAQQIKIELLVDDKGTATIANFAGNATAALERAKKGLEGFGQSWQAMVVVYNQGVELFQKIVGYVEAPIKAYMESETALLKMGMAMKNQGDFSRAALTDLEDFAVMLQKTTAFEDDFALGVMGTLKSFGMSNEEIKKYMTIMADYSAATGKGMDDMATAVGKAYLGNTTALKKMGVQLDETKTGTEQFDAAMVSLGGRFSGSAQAELLTYAGQWKQMRNIWGDIQEFLGLVFLKTIEAIMFTFSMMGAGFWTVVKTMLQGLGWLTDKLGAFANFVGLEKVSNGLGVITDALKAGATNAEEAAAAATRNAVKNYDNMVSFDKVTSAIEKMGAEGKRTRIIDEEAAKAAKKSAEERERAITALTEAIRKQNIEVEGINQTQYEKDIIRIEAEADKWYEKSKDKVKVSQWMAGEVLIAEAARAKEEEKIAQKSMEDAVKLIFEEADANAQANDQKKADDIKAATDKLAAERTLYKDLKGVSGLYYEGERAVILAEAENRKKVLLNGVTDAEEAARTIGAIEAAKQNKLRELDIEQAKRGDDFFAGMTAGYLQMKTDAETWGTAGYEAFNSFSTNSATAVKTVLFDAFTGHVTDFKEVWKSFTDSLLSTLADIISRMIVQWGLYKTAAAAASAFNVAIPAGFIDPFAAAGAGTSGQQALTGAAAYGAYTGGGALALEGSVAALGGGSAAANAAANAAFLASEGASVGGLATGTSLLPALGGALPWIGGALLADQMLFGGQGTQAVVSGIGAVFKGAGSIVKSVGKIFGFAEGGAYPSGKPFWAGEKGPELIFPEGSGQVLNNRDSKLFAAMTGGKIPGYASGTIDPSMYETALDYRRAVALDRKVQEEQITYTKNLVDIVEDMAKNQEGTASETFKALDKQFQATAAIYQETVRITTAIRTVDYNVLNGTTAIVGAVSAIKLTVPAATGASSGWNEAAYLAANPDVAAVVAQGTWLKSGLQHYQQFGIAEGRIKGFAAGGIASGPDSGYGATLHGTELIISPRSSYPATVRGGDTVILIEELRALRKEVAQVTKHTRDTADRVKPIYEWDEIGMPATQT